MKLKDCPQCGRRYYYRFDGQWRCPRCTAKWRNQKNLEREQQVLEEQYKQVHAPDAPPPLATAPADVSAAGKTE